MTHDIARQRLVAELDRRHAEGRPARFWLRDDDAVEPGAALERFLEIVTRAGVPATLAVIPQSTGSALSDFLERFEQARGLRISVALHGWSHQNHAGSREKKQELGSHRPLDVVLSELGEGLEKLDRLHARRFIPMLVPPWNRISPDLVPRLPEIGIRCLSVFGPEKREALPLLNTHVDVMDWHGTRGGRESAVLLDEITARLQSMGSDGSMGLLTHHLVHDAKVDLFLGELFALTANHEGCIWMQAADIIGPITQHSV